MGRGHAGLRAFRLAIRTGNEKPRPRPGLFDSASIQLSLGWEGSLSPWTALAEREGKSLPKQNNDLGRLTPERGPIDNHRASSGVANPCSLATKKSKSHLDSAKSSVRECPSALALEGDHQDQAKRPAHPSNRFVAQLNERWRVVDDPLQWVLQRRKGNPREKNSGWEGRSFPRTRKGLLRCIREYCCSSDQGHLRSIREYNGVDQVALQQVRALSDWHPDWDRQHAHTNLDVLGTDQARSEHQASPLVSKASGVCDAGE